MRADGVNRSLALEAASRAIRKALNAVLDRSSSDSAPLFCDFLDALGFRKAADWLAPLICSGCGPGGKADLRGISEIFEAGGGTGHSNQSTASRRSEQSIRIV
jgi:hypothetical protein